MGLSTDLIVYPVHVLPSYWKSLNRGEYFCYIDFTKPGNPLYKILERKSEYKGEVAVSDAILLYVLRVIDLDRSLIFYRDMLRFNPFSYDPEQGTARLFTPDGGILFLTTDPELDVAALLEQEGDGGSEETAASLLPAEDIETEGVPSGTEEEPADLMETRGSETETSPSYEIREVEQGEGLHFPGEDLLVSQERLAAFGIPDLLLEETPGVEQVLKMHDPDGYEVSLHESLRLTDEEVIDLYNKGPDLLEVAVMGLEEDLDLTTPEGESLRQLILQIVDFDLEMMQRIKWAMAENGRAYTIPLYDPDEWAESLSYSNRPVHVEVQMFRLLREHILHQLEAVPEAMNHHLVSEQGSVEVRTMLQVVAETSREQIQTILNTRHQYGK